MSENYTHVLVGQEDDRKIFFEYGEYLKVLKFAKAGATDGARGVLLGEKTENGVYIQKVIEAVYSGDESLETPVFSPRSWGRICAEIDNYYSGLEILGQFSTHPSLTPRRNDYIMQDRFFSKKSNLLFVFDPVDNSEKFYFFEDNEFRFLNGFYLHDKYNVPIDLRRRESVVRPLCREYELRMRFVDSVTRKLRCRNNIYAVFAVVIILLTFFNFYCSYAVDKRIDELIADDEEITEWKKE